MINKIWAQVGVKVLAEIADIYLSSYDEHSR